MPDTAARRIVYLDIVRGLSILGILFVNAVAFAMPMHVYINPAISPLGLTDIDTAVWWVDEVFFTGKFITIFSMLFGVSLYLISASDPDDLPLTQRVIGRRLGWMVIFGLIHGALIWYGDILLLYAICGFVFFSWRNLEAKPLLVVGSVLYLIGNGIILWPAINDGIGVIPEPSVPMPDLLNPTIELMRSGFTGSLRGNFTMWSQSIINEILFYLPVTVGLMMIGLGLFKSGFLRGESRSVTYAAIIVLAGASLTLIGGQAAVIIAEGFPAVRIMGLYAIANEYLSIIVSLGYVSTLILIARTSWGLKLLSPLRDAGRMAFTNYLLQSLIMTVIFYGGRAPESWGLGLYGTVGNAGLVPVVTAIWAGQLIVSSLWMRAFRYGPFEWGWRCLSHQRWMPILK
ncbi:DUF418 domain-containing protein [Asticcacaulis machinosus]|uniref:DUF418 domain-containing protein n=1 Tax=Asticcacaulis machinosus TaxID=2984211 RepID=A0ABT5HIF2_9CAUL|nr:DUF418 domain-containing protein [Asticcacaulis machinosus]MDC7676024.1 DUF418 domain-containing protein [Asticcacaulis machinosus]